MYFVVMGQDAKGTSTRKMRAIAVDTPARILRVIISLASCHITTNTFIINKNARA